MIEPNKLPITVAAAAEYYGSLGWRVFPLYEMAGAVCSCSKGSECTTPGKHPRVSIPKGEGSVHPATSDLDQIRKWWVKWPTANIGFWLEGSKIAILDIDKNDKKDGFKGLEEIMQYEHQSKMPDTLTCKTPSGGLHLYFQFLDGLPNKANALGPGLDIWHSGHYVILPPSNHVKGTYSWGSADPIAPYPEWLKPKEKGVDPVTGEKRKAGRPSKERLDINDEEEVQRLIHALRHVNSTDRETWVSVGFALARAFDWNERGYEIYNGWAAGAHNYDEKKTREQYKKQSKVIPANPITTATIFEWARRDPNYQAWTPTDDRPYEIKEKDANQLGVLVDIAEVIPDFPIYQRGPKLVEIIPVNQEGGVQDGASWYPKGSYILREIQADQLASRILPAKVRWMRKTKNGWRASAVSLPLCAAFLNIGNWPKALKLRAFVQHPTLRDDGTLLQSIGYDKKSGLFLTDFIPIKVNEKAQRGEALKALAVLMHPFSEFKWTDGNISRSALLAAIITTGIRHLFDEGVPLFAIDAPRQGSGKSKLVKCISNLWFGRPASVTSYSNDHEEMKKHLASMLLNGDRIVLFDNVHPTIRVNDPTLNALLTAGRITFRELGSQRMLELDSAATFFMTGNSLKIIGDMIRRTIRLQIDPEGLHPMDRKFKIDPVETYILQHRVELLSAALTILIAFFNAGCPVPKGLVALASFERWSELVRNLILWLDMDDVKESISQGYEQDDESMEIEHLLARLAAIPQLHTDGLSSAMLLPLIEADKSLKEAMQPFINERHHQGINHPRVVTTILQQVAKIKIRNRKLLRVGPVWVIREGE